MLRRKPRTTPDAWARDNRVYPKTSGVPGPRDPALTPYLVEFARAAASGRYKRTVATVGAQMGKTDMMLDVIGQRLDQRPVPILYVGPTKDFVVDQFEPRVVGLLEQSASLAAKTAWGKANKKARKIVAGVPLRLAHAGSSSALKSDQAGMALVDEYDELLANVKGQGDPLGLVEARGFSYGGEFSTMVASTPSVGSIETEIDPETGLEFWKEADPEDIKSPIWRLWQQGTQFHWAWPCPHCGEFFIPRFKQLRWPERATPAQARRGAFLCCPANGCVIEDADETRKAMNAAGVLIARGQRIENGIVVGDPPENSTWSMWASGLCSPFVSWGERAEGYLLALATGEEAKIQTEINAGFGECYALGGTGDIYEWTEVRRRIAPYRKGECPSGVLAAVAGVDVQKRSLIFVVRGFGVSGRSWLLDYGQIYGTTDDDGGVWDELWSVLQTDYGTVPVSLAFVDSGFRPDKREAGSEHRVYAFARQNHHLIRAIKGQQTLASPIVPKRHEIEVGGGRAKSAIELCHLSTDYFKSLVHSRLRLPELHPETWSLPEDITEDYCRQIVSEVRTISPVGKPLWVRKSRNNHFLDCEAMAAAAAFYLRLHNLTEEHAETIRVARLDAERPDLAALDARRQAPQEPDPAPVPAAAPPPRRDSYLGPSRRGWLTP